MMMAMDISTGIMVEEVLHLPAQLLIPKLLGRVEFSMNLLYRENTMG
jgi:hypothetical protein